MFFGRCVTKFRQTMPMTTHIKTKAVVDATITVTDVRVIRLYPNQVPDTEKPKVSKIRENQIQLQSEGYLQTAADTCQQECDQIANLEHTGA